MAENGFYRIKEAVNYKVKHLFNKLVFVISLRYRFLNLKILQIFYYRLTITNNNKYSFVRLFRQKIKNLKVK